MAKASWPHTCITGMLGELGATLRACRCQLCRNRFQRGVIDGAVIHMEVSVPLKVAELVDSHTGFVVDTGLYTATFGVLMNKAKYQSLPEDLRAIIDANTGPKWRLFGIAMDKADKVGLKIAQDSGNNVVFLDAAEKAKWQEAVKPVWQTGLQR